MAGPASLPRRFLKRFAAINIAACDRIERCLPRRFTRSLLYLHELTVARHMNAAPGRHVIDIGGGHLCPFAGHRRPGLGTRITALDILPDQLRRNLAADLRVAADATRTLPLADGCADLVVTRSVLEHLPDPARTFGEAARVLLWLMRQDEGIRLISVG